MNRGLRGCCNKGIPIPRVLCHSLTEVTQVPGKGMIILQNFQVRKFYRTSRSSGYCGTDVHNSQKFRVGTKHAVPVPRVLWPRACRTSRRSGCRYECRTELQEVPGTGMKVLQNIQEFFVGQYPG